jgi:hypothetical protein
MAPHSDSDEQTRIEQLLIDTLLQAKAEYEASKRSFELATINSIDLGPNHPDGTTAVTQATKNNNRALRRYRLALKRFNRFVLDRQIPGSLKRQ